MTLATVLAFATMAALLVVSPGPNGVLIAKTVPTSGMAVGFANIAGFNAAFFMHGAFSIFGISLILLHSANLFTAVKLAGAAYLIWIGFCALREAWRGGKPSFGRVEPSRRRRSLQVGFGEGFLTNALNPKVSLFYLAAFPQFIPAASVSPTSAFLLVAIHAAMNALWFGLMVVLLARLSTFARDERLQRMIKAATGFVFIGFGLKLATIRP